MYRNHPENEPLKIKKEELPLTIDAAVVDSWKTQSFLGRAIAVVGFIILLFSAGITIFGPNHIYANAITGPTFWQTVQLNPGLVFILGVFVIAGGRWLSNAAWKKIPRYVEKNFVLYNDSCKPEEDAELVGLPGEDGQLMLIYHSLEDNEDAKQP